MKKIITPYLSRDWYAVFFPCSEKTDCTAECFHFKTPANDIVAMESKRR